MVEAAYTCADINRFFTTQPENNGGYVRDQYEGHPCDLSVKMVSISGPVAAGMVPANEVYFKALLDAGKTGNCKIVLLIFDDNFVCSAALALVTIFLGPFGREI